MVKIKRETFDFCKLALENGKKAFKEDPKAINCFGARAMVSRIDHVLSILNAVDKPEVKISKKMVLNDGGILFVKEFPGRVALRRFVGRIRDRIYLFKLSRRNK